MLWSLTFYIMHLNTLVFFFSWNHFTLKGIENNFQASAVCCFSNQCTSLYPNDGEAVMWLSAFFKMAALNYREWGKRYARHYSKSTNIALVFALKVYPLVLRIIVILILMPFFKTFFPTCHFIFWSTPTFHWVSMK